MSVEKIAPLREAAADAVAMRAVSGPGSSHPRPPPFPPPEPPTDAAPHLYDSLVLPLSDGAAREEGAFSSALVRDSYRTQAAWTQIESLVDGGLPDTVLRREVETLLRHAAQARGVDVRRLIEEAEQTPPERLPSRNLKGARFSFRGRLAAAGEDGRLKGFDLYLTRIGARQWEAAVFERDPSRAGQSFPRAAPLLEAHRLLIEPATGLVLACVAQQIPAAGFSLAARAALFPAALWRAVAFPALAAMAGLLAARFFSGPAAAIFLLGLAAIALGWRRR